MESCSSTIVWNAMKRHVEQNSYVALEQIVDSWELWVIYRGKEGNSVEVMYMQHDNGYKHKRK